MTVRLLTSTLRYAFIVALLAVVTHLRSAAQSVGVDSAVDRGDQYLVHDVADASTNDRVVNAGGMVDPDPSPKADGEVDSNAAERADLILFPQDLGTGQYRHAIGLALAVLPGSVSEDQLRQVPTLDYRARIGLPLNFSLTGRVTSNFLTNYAALGGRWNTALGDVSVDVGADLAFWNGIARLDGFDITAQSWLNFLSVGVGYEFDRVFLTVKGEAQYITSVKTRTDGVIIESTSNRLGGYGVSFSVEQLSWGDTFLALGIKVNRSRAIYQGWLAFNSIDRLLTYPEFFLGIVL